MACAEVVKKSFVERSVPGEVGRIIEVGDELKLFERVMGLTRQELELLLPEGSIIIGSKARELAVRFSGLDGLEPFSQMVSVRDGRRGCGGDRPPDIDVLVSKIPEGLEEFPSRTFPGAKHAGVVLPGGQVIHYHSLPAKEYPDLEGSVRFILPTRYELVCIKRGMYDEFLLVDLLNTYSLKDGSHEYTGHEPGHGDSLNPYFLENLPNLPLPFAISMLLRAFLAQAGSLNKDHMELLREFATSHRHDIDNLNRQHLESIGEAVRRVSSTRPCYLSNAKRMIDSIGFGYLYQRLLTIS